MSLGVIINGNAGMLRKKPKYVSLVAEKAKPLGEVRITHSGIDIKHAAEEFSKKDIDLLVINGGDGTDHLTITSFLEIYGSQPLPPIYLLKGGTMNTIGRAMGIRGSLESCLADLLKRYNCHIQTGEGIKTRDNNLLEIDGRYGFIFGEGSVINMMEDYYSGERGAKGALKVTLKTIGSAFAGTQYIKDLFRTFDAEVFVDGIRLPYKEVSIIICATVRELGLGIKPTFRADEDPEKFHAICTKMGPIQITNRLLDFYLCNEVRRKDFYSNIAREVKILSEEGRKYTIDGEFYHAGNELNIRKGPRLKFVV